MIAGPASLEVSAGGQIYQAAASLTSLGPLVPGDTRPGAGITLQEGPRAGAPGEGTVDYTGFAAALPRRNPARRHRPAAGRPAWQGRDAPTRPSWPSLAGPALRLRGPGRGRCAWPTFSPLPARAAAHLACGRSYFAELTAGGREYNDADSPRYGSYLRGRDAIATLFPDTDAAGQPIRRAGDITLY